MCAIHFSETPALYTIIQEQNQAICVQLLVLLICAELPIFILKCVVSVQKIRTKFTVSYFSGKKQIKTKYQTPSPHPTKKPRKKSPSFSLLYSSIN